MLDGIFTSGQTAEVFRASESDSDDYELLTQPRAEGLWEDKKMPVASNIPTADWGIQVDEGVDALLSYGKPVGTDGFTMLTAACAGAKSCKDSLPTAGTLQHQWVQYAAQHACKTEQLRLDDHHPHLVRPHAHWAAPMQQCPINLPHAMLNASAEPREQSHGWLMPEGYGRSCDDMMCASGSPEPCQYEDMAPAPMGWSPFDMCDEQGASMSGRISTMEPQNSCQLVHFAATPSASCHHSLSGSQPDEGSELLKQEHEVYLDKFDAGTDGLTDSGSLQLAVPPPRNATPEVVNEAHCSIAPPHVERRKPSPLATTVHHNSNRGQGNCEPKLTVKQQPQCSSQETHEPYRTTASGRRCNPRPVYVDLSDEDFDEDGEEETSGSDASDDEDALPAGRGAHRQKRAATRGKAGNKRQCGAQPIKRVVNEKAEEDTEDSKKYRGVTRKVNGRYEAQLHDSLEKDHDLKGEQVYLGVYTSAKRAAKAYDLAALKFVGREKAVLNLTDENYDTDEHKEARKKLSSKQYLAYLKANSDAERGKSGFHGVACRSNDRWQARITGVACFGTFSTKEEAARAYDVGSIHLFGEAAVLNYPIFDYWDFDNKQLKTKWKVPDSALDNSGKTTKKRKRGQQDRRR